MQLQNYCAPFGMSRGSVCDGLTKTLALTTYCIYRANQMQEGPSYNIYEDALIYQSDEKAPQLISEMSNEQYLDAISCPRDDPVTQGKKVMQSSADMDDPSDVEDDVSNLDDGTLSAPDDGSQSDASDGGRIYETLPEGAIQASSKMERRIEKVCRMIHSASLQEIAELETRFLESTAGYRYQFLDACNKYHAYYRWRLERNRAGKGIDAQYDYGMGLECGKELRLEL